MVWIRRPWVTQHGDLMIISDMKIFSNSSFSWGFSYKFMVKDQSFWGYCCEHTHHSPCMCQLWLKFHLIWRSFHCIFTSPSQIFQAVSLCWFWKFLKEVLMFWFLQDKLTPKFFQRRSGQKFQILHRKNGWTQLRSRTWYALLVLLIVLSCLNSSVWRIFGSHIHRSDYSRTLLVNCASQIW